MKIEIKSRWSRSVLFVIETDSWRLALEAAVRQGADLRGADLRGADLFGADLRDANLLGADLRGADLRDANLRDANLRGADLRGADLFGADLRDANLRGADLRGADLPGADLLDARNIHPARANPLVMLKDQPGPIRAYKLVTAEGVGPYNGGIKYEIGQEYAVENANSDEQMACGAGINLASLDWVLAGWQAGYRILIAEFFAADIAAIPINSYGKFRVRRCRIVGEKTLAEVGLA